VGPAEGEKDVVAVVSTSEEVIAKEIADLERRLAALRQAYEALTGARVPLMPVDPVDLAVPLSFTRRPAPHDDSYDPDKPFWYWAVFRDDHVLGSTSLRCEIVTQWFDTVDEAQSQMQRFDRDTHRIHGVLRSDND
jgi:hypothetical protein